MRMVVCKKQEKILSRGMANLVYNLKKYNIYIYIMMILEEVRAAVRND